ncbi:MAG: hypothetical protein AB7R90_10525 [Reyranellaceae bacterium]
MSGVGAEGGRIDGTDPTGDGELSGFSLVRGGPIYRLLNAVGLAPTGLRGAIILSAVLAGFCLVPLVVLTGFAGTLSGPMAGVPLSGDFGALGRFLIGLPALVLIAPDSDRLLRLVLSHFVTAGIVRRADRPAFAGILRDALRLRDATWPELILVAGAFVPALMALEQAPLLPPLPGWRLADGGLSPAGIWFDFVAKPLWLLIALLWVWRLALWALMLARICRLDLALHAAHPDGVGGLGFVPAMQQRFSRCAFAGGVIFAGAAANEIVYGEMPLSDAGWVLAAYIACATFVLCVPLLVLTPTLVRLKRRGILAYGALGNAYMLAFDAKWLGARGDAAGLVEKVRAGPLDELGGDYGSLTDLNASYLIAQRIPIVPINRWVLAGIVLPAALPMAPVALLALGIQDTVRKLLEMLT